MRRTLDPVRLGPLVDHHVHGVVRGELDRAGFELLISESGAPPAGGTSHFDAPIGVSLLRACAPVLDLEPDAGGDAYVGRRRELGADEVNRRLLRRSGLDLLLVDTGHRTDDVARPSEMAELSGVPALEVVRVERETELFADECASPRAFLEGLPETLAERARSAVGLKTIVAYRYGLDLPVKRPSRDEVSRASEEWFGETGRRRLSSPVLLAEVLHLAMELSAREQLPLQVHAGFGDTDLQLDRANPTLFTPWIRHAGEIGASLVFLHCYPYHREAGYLTEVFPHVFFDVGCILNYAGPSARRVLAEALEMAPFGKMLYSSDAFGLSELVYLGAQQFRRFLAEILDGFVENGEITTDEAARWAGMISRDNARRLYPLERRRSETTSEEVARA